MLREFFKTIKLFYNGFRCKDPCLLCIVKPMCSAICTEKIYEIGMKNTFTEQKRILKHKLSCMMTTEFFLDKVITVILTIVIFTCLLAELYCIIAMILIPFDVHFPTPMDIMESIRNLF